MILDLNFRRLINLSRAHKNFNESDRQSPRRRSSSPFSRICTDSRRKLEEAIRWILETKDEMDMDKGRNRRKPWWRRCRPRAILRRDFVGFMDYKEKQDGGGLLVTTRQ